MSASTTKILLQKVVNSMQLMILGAFFGSLLGICSSFIAWLLVQHVFVPRIKFWPEISCKKSSHFSCGFSYRITFSNSGFRDIMDLNVIAEIVTENLHGTQVASFEYARPPLDANCIPYLDKGKSRAVSIHIFETERFSKPVYGERINNKHANGTLRLEDLLEVSEMSYLRIYVFGFDKFSGTRKVYRSKRYTLQDIKHGTWNKRLAEN